MSVTFWIDSSETAFPTCPACGGTMGAGGPSPDPACEHDGCQGYGPDPVESVPSMNLANANARVFLRDILDVHDDEDLCGRLDPDQVQQRLAVAETRIAGAVRPTVQSGNCISFGLTEGQLRSYCRRLAVLAEVASRRREPILYG